jgi:hypothetical protein
LFRINLLCHVESHSAVVPYRDYVPYS